MLDTFSGRRLNPLLIMPGDVVIEDLAHALALVNRFGGQSRFPISVAQHSVLVSLLCEGTPDDLAGLLHDGSEAYLGDMTKWLKMTPEMEPYRTAEARAQDSVFVAFNIPVRSFPTVEWADRMAVRYEFELAFGRGQVDEGYGMLGWGEYETVKRIAARWPYLWRPMMSWQEAEMAFLQRFRDLTMR